MKGIKAWPMIGQTISHYEIVGKLGEGGMGVVYKAKDRKLDRFVALKFLPLDLIRNEKATERFIYEARAASSIEHPNICTIYGIDEMENGQIFIAMAYYEGESLRERIDRGPIAVGEAIEITIQAGVGLAKAHEKGIVHRDMKPANLMITDDGMVKIVDFGLAILAGETRLTREGTTVGTIAYMSPEQTRGGDVDHRTDIWSLGVVMYEMITGQLPFKGHYDQAVVYSIMNEQPEPPGELKGDVPPQLEQIIDKALAKQVERRYQHMSEMLDDLHLLRRGHDSTQQVAAKGGAPSIAVLPFDNLSTEKEQEYFCDGMAEEITNALTHVENLRVVARTSAFAFKGTRGDVREIGNKLGVDNLLEGSVRKAGTRLRITAQLVSVADGYHIWSEKYDRDLEDVFSIQDEIALAIVDKLKIKLLKSEKVKVMKRYTDNPEAYTIYLKGRYFWNRRYEGGLQKAIEYFKQAIDKDPLYAPAYTGIADSYNLLGLYGLLPPREAYSKAKDATEKGLGIDETVAEAHVSMGWISMFFDWDWPTAEREFKRALDLNPNYPTAHEWYGIFLAVIGRVEEGITEAKMAQALDPLSLTISAMVGWNVGLARRYDEAIDILRKTIEMDPRFPLTYFFLGVAYAMKAMGQEAVETHQKLVAVTEEAPYAVGFLGMSYAMAGKHDEAKSMLDRLNALSKRRYVSPFYKALIYIGLDDKDHAFEFLEKAYAVRESYMALIKVLPIFDPIRTDPRYTALIQKMGL